MTRNAKRPGVTSPAAPKTLDCASSNTHVSTVVASATGCPSGRVAIHASHSPRWRDPSTARRHPRFRSDPAQQARFAEGAHICGWRFDPSVRGPQRTACPYPEHHAHGDGDHDATICLDGCWARCHVLGKSIGFVEMLDASGLDRSTTGPTIANILALVAFLLDLPPVVFAALIEPARERASLRCRSNLSTDRFGAITRKTLRAWLTMATAGDDPHTRNVGLSANTFERETGGTNRRFFGVGLIGLDALGIASVIGESGRDWRVIGQRRATALLDPHTDRPTKLHETECTADPARLAVVVANARAMLVTTGTHPSDDSPIVAPDGVCTPGQADVLIAAGLAATATGTPLRHRPGRAHVAAWLAREVVMTVDQLAALCATSRAAMVRRLRMMAADGMVHVTDVVTLTAHGVDVTALAVAAGRVIVDERCDRHQDAWKAHQVDAATAWLDLLAAATAGPGTDDHLAPPHPDAAFVPFPGDPSLMLNESTGELIPRPLQPIEHDLWAEAA